MVSAEIWEATPSGETSPARGGTSGRALGQWAPWCSTKVEARAWVYAIFSYGSYSEGPNQAEVQQLKDLRELVGAAGELVGHDIGVCSMTNGKHRAAAHAANSLGFTFMTVLHPEFAF